jgi:ATP-dependent RNA helicase DeaD
MLRGARIAAQWVSPPSADDIRRADSERLLATLLAPVEIDEQDRALAERLLTERTPQEIAGALVRAHRARLPEPEDLLGSDAPQESRAPRAGFEGSAWFRLNIGRNQNADPRWVLPLLCRRGHVNRTEIGAIRIAANETLFEVPGALAARFLDAARRTANDEDEVEIVPVEGKPRDEARRHRRDNAKPTYAPKPHRPHPARSDQGKPDAKRPDKKGFKKGAWGKKPDRAK